MNSDIRAVLDQLRSTAEHAEQVWHSKVPLPELRQYHEAFRPEVALWLLDLLDVMGDSNDFSVTFAEHRGAVETVAEIESRFESLSGSDVVPVEKVREVLRAVLSGRPAVQL